MDESNEKFMTAIQVEIEKAQQYGEEFGNWLESHKHVEMTKEQSRFIILTLTKYIYSNPAIMLCSSEIIEICKYIFILGYRTGWENSKADSLLGGNKK